MATGQYLRTNYRATGKEVDIDALGLAMLSCSRNAGPGTIRPCGGLIFMSLSGAFCDVGGGTVMSGAFGDSTLGTLSLYYGSGNFGSGYLFLPVYMGTLSYSTKGVAANWIGDNAAPHFRVMNITTSGSVWMISAMKVSGALGGSGTYASEVHARLLIFGFVVSGPNL